MKTFNKAEVTGFIISIAAMAFALYIIKTDTPFWDADKVVKENTEEVVFESKDASELSLEQTLLDAMDKDGNVIKLVASDTRLGGGDAVEEGDLVVVNYIGATQEQGRFDSSYERGEPFVFRVGAGTVIQGWDKGIIGMKVGGQRALVIPSNMAYGNMQVGPIPPNTPLIFSIELLEIR